MRIASKYTYLCCRMITATATPTAQQPPQDEN
jgi:hypothetical protein